jgi:Fe-S-cluster containining protein
MIETQADIGGQRLGREESFCFACHPGLACFNSCCRHKRLPLWPYDVLRLRRGLSLDSPQVLERYAELEFDPRSGWPSLRLRLDDKGRCPLLTPEGCGVYPHRPAACRIYPLAWAAKPAAEGEPPLELFVRQETKGCLGWDEAKEHTPAGWVEDQGLEPYLEANAALLGLFFHPQRKGRLKLSQPQTHAVIAALYNLDVLRQMAAQPAFAAQTGLEASRIERALESDEALLNLGRDWLAARLFSQSS